MTNGQHDTQRPFIQGSYQALGEAIRLE